MFSFYFITIYESLRILNNRVRQNIVFPSDRYEIVRGAHGKRKKKSVAQSALRDRKVDCAVRCNKLVFFNSYTIKNTLGYHKKKIAKFPNYTTTKNQQQYTY